MVDLPRPRPRLQPSPARAFLLAFLAAAALGPGSLPGRSESHPVRIQFRAGASNLVLQGEDAVQQVLATTRDDRGTELDLTRSVRWFVEPAHLARVDASGRVTALADGRGALIAVPTNGPSASLPLVVRGSAEPLPLHFANQIVPIFTKYGCNGGGCHGKAAGQNGFRLSLLGFEPAEDYEHLVREARARRLFPAAPERSLLLTKGTAELPHGGGQRLVPGSDDYRLLVRWIRQGMPVGRPDAPTVERIEVFPRERSLAAGTDQQLAVTAHYSDGSTADVTRGALYEPNDKDLAQCDENGLLRVASQTGEFGVMVRYQGKVTTFRGTIPLGAPVDALPPSRGFVDDLVFARLREVGLPPSGVADDATFLRRVTLDLAGRTPSPDEIEAFRTAPGSSESRRDAVIERLVASPESAEYFANKWSALLRNRRTDPRHARGTYAFHAWIRDSFAANKPYDRFVREILTASGEVSENPPVAWYRQLRSMQTQLEDLSQLFLGQRLQCAQCHHHPYEKWSQADYWSFGAFFSQVSYKPGAQPGEDTIVHRRGAAQATNKKNGQPVKPAGLAQPPVTNAPDDDPRQDLADWMTAPGNPWFARALVNRYWKHFFGRGLVDPEDDLRETNPPTNPELLDALAARFAATGFDLRELLRTLARSSAYQLAAEPNAHNARDRHHFSRFYPRRLPAEVLYDTVHLLIGAEPRFDGLPPGTRAVCLPDNSFNTSSYFLTVFGRPESSSACECERSMDASLSQSLHLLNSKELQAQLAADTSRPARLAADTSRDTAAKVRELTLLAFARDPSPDEVRFAEEHLARRLAAAPAGKDAAESDALRLKARREAWEDTVWALLNTKEFLFNH